jgi:xanthine dehydrogenase accessory factor
MKSIFNKICEFLESNQQGMLATIVWTSGSTPAPAQSKMLLDANGNRIAGTIGGGCVEDAIMRRCAVLEDKQHAVIMDFELNDDEAESGLICGGTLKILLEPINQSHLGIYKSIATRYNTGLESVLVTQLNPDGKITKSLLDGSFGILSGDLENISIIPKTIFKKYEPVLQNIGGSIYITEPIEGKLPLYIFGGGHVGKAIAKFSSLVGFNVTVVDDRIEFANKNTQPDADEVICVPFRNILENLELSNSAFVVIVTRGHRYDELVLEQVIHLKPKYIGMIGSKRKVLVAFQHLIQKGVHEGSLKQVFAPVGLDLGSISVEEIAVSIVAEMIKVKRKGMESNPSEHKKLPQ